MNKDWKTGTIASILTFVILFSLCSYFASAAPPVTTVQQITEGFQIIDSPQLILKLNQDYQYNFFVSNISNGALQTNISASCIFYLANSSGKIILYSKVPYVPEGYWGLDIAGANFSSIGYYAYGTRCNSTTLAGSTTGLLYVTQIGIDSSNQNFIPMILSIGGIIVIILILAYVLAEHHGIVSAVFAGLGIYLLIPLLNVANMALENEYYDSGISGMVGTITTILTWLDYALIVYIVVYLFVKVISGYNQDKQEKIEGLK